jgi:hypothetical protein
MEQISAELTEAAVLTRAGWVNEVVVAGVILSATVCFLRYRRQEEFEVLSVKFPLKLFPLFCLGYTCAHAYCAYIFASICYSSSPSPQAWLALTLKGPLVFNGMLPRDKLWDIPFPFGVHIPVTHIRSSDPTLWLFYSFCGVIYFGFTWSCELAGFSTRKTRSLAVLLLVSNWIVGSFWANAASTLAN